MRLHPTRKSDQPLKRAAMALLLLAALGLAGLWFATPVLSVIGRFPVWDQRPGPADAAVVLYTGVEYYPRLMEAARRYTDGLVKSIVVNGNRKSDILRRLEEKGFVPCCHWAEDTIRILGLFGVPRDRIITVSAEDAFDTISEAEAVGKELLQSEIRSILLTTSKSHTRRARHIWNRLYGDRLSITAVSARTDPYDPDGWWRDGRQVRWVLAEYGAWVYYWWMTM